MLTCLLISEVCYVHFSTEIIVINLAPGCHNVTVVGLNLLPYQSENSEVTLFYMNLPLRLLNANKDQMVGIRNDAADT